MEYETEFYKLLKLAVTDDVALIRVLDKIMKLINNNSKDMRGIIDEDLKSELITYSVELIRNKKIYKKFKNTIQNKKSNDIISINKKTEVK